MVFPFYRTAENQVEPERVNTQAAASEFAPKEREICSIIVFIDCGLQIPGNVSKWLFSAYQTYHYDCKNKQKNVVGATKSYLYLYII